MYVDLDNFKHVNDSRGHQAGDDVLIEVRNIMLQHTRPTDMVARLGGDEFACWLTGADLAIAKTRAAQFLQRVSDLAPTNPAAPTGRWECPSASPPGPTTATRRSTRCWRGPIAPCTRPNTAAKVTSPFAAGGGRVSPEPAAAAGSTTPAKDRLVRLLGLPGQKITYEQARDLLDHPDPAVRAALAARADVEPEILFFLARDPDRDGAPHGRRPTARIAGQSQPVAGRR